MTDQPRKLIEVALPLDEINAACKADKDRKTGTIRNLHKWFAPMPLPAWRALIYAALIDDPDNDEKRAYHLDVIKRLVANGADLPDQDTLDEAKRNLERQFPDGVPPVMDPFCGGGSTLVEAQRLGLPTYGSDLNPVPVLITRTLTELLPKVYGQQPLNPEMVNAESKGVGRGNPSNVQEALTPSTGGPKVYTRYEGLIRDVSFYAERADRLAWERLQGHFPSPAGETPVAWLWARTATCPNPACGIQTVLATSWWLSKKKGDRAWIEPRVEAGQVILEVVSGRRDGGAPNAPKAGRGAVFQCLGCDSVVDEDSVVGQGLNGELGLRLTCVVSDKRGVRTFRAPSAEEALVAVSVPSVDDFPDVLLPNIPRWFSGPRFGFMTQADLYTPRQLLVLSVLADLVSDVHADIVAAGGTPDWASAVATLLGLAVGRAAQYQSTQVRWFIDSRSGAGQPIPAFARHDLPMQWDFVEPDPRSSSGSLAGATRSVTSAVKNAAHHTGIVERVDARVAHMPLRYGGGLVAADPPYFDAIGYADLSDYFYLWHRRALRGVHPDLYATVAAPKQGELTAIPAHHGNSVLDAREYFISGFTETFRNLQASLLDGLPLLVVYASKEQKGGAGEETRWSSILTAMVGSGLEITGAWPVRGTKSDRLVGLGTNAVATYVVMTARPRPTDAGTCSLSEFNRALRRELKPAVQNLQAAGILPVDLAQAAMGPGMQVYSRYRDVLGQSGERVPVDQALRLINQALSEVLDEQEGELDPDSRFAVTWWEKHHWADAAFGEADQLARPHGISVDDVIRAGVAIYPKPGFVRVIGDVDLDRSWMPSADSRPTAWEAVHHLADRLIDGGGTSDAGALMAQLGILRDQAQGLVYRLHAIAARKGWTKDQERYNSLIGSWSDLLAEAGRVHGEVLF